MQEQAILLIVYGLLWTSTLSHPRNGAFAPTKSHNRLNRFESSCSHIASKALLGSRKINRTGRFFVSKVKKNNRLSPYATAADFRQIFAEDVNRLYLLSLLLTGNHEKAEQCFVEGIAETTKANRIFKEWARSWARRTIIQNAIRLNNPQVCSVTESRSGDAAKAIAKIPMLLQEEVRAILELPPLDRFVFVMSVLERFSDHDCSILLGCTRRDIVKTRINSMQRLVTVLGLQRTDRMDADRETVIKLAIAQHFATAGWTGSLSQ